MLHHLLLTGGVEVKPRLQYVHSQQRDFFFLAVQGGGDSQLLHVCVEAAAVGD